MTRKAKKLTKPKTPADIRAEALARRAADLAAVGMSATSALLSAHHAVEITRAGQQKVDGKTVQNDMARRLDAFEALRHSMKGQAFVGAYDAARRFERDILVSLDLNDRGPSEKVDGGGSRFDRTDAIVAASKRVKEVRALLSDRDGWLLVELIIPSRQGEEWRATVGRLTGEENPNAQGAAVRAACVNLRDVYEKMQGKARRAA